MDANTILHEVQLVSMLAAQLVAPHLKKDDQGTLQVIEADILACTQIAQQIVNNAKAQAAPVPPAE